LEPKSTGVFSQGINDLDHPLGVLSAKQHAGSAEVGIFTASLPLPPLQDLHKICTKRLISLQIFAFSCICLPVLL
jgi:hypothetical protein